MLNRLYGVRTSVIYDVDHVAKRLGAHLVGFEERPASLDAMRESTEVYFVKTHRQRGREVDEMDRAICLVRDGRDALVSWARLNSDGDPARFATELRAMVTRRDQEGTGSWGRNVLSWLRPPAPHRVVLRYEKLTREPRRAVEESMAALLPQMQPNAHARIPSFAELGRVDDRFFRRGRAGTHREEMSDELHMLFWSNPDNITAMSILGHRAPS